MSHKRVTHPAMSTSTAAHRVAHDRDHQSQRLLRPGTCTETGDDQSQEHRAVACVGMTLCYKRWGMGHMTHSEKQPQAPPVI